METSKFAIFPVHMGRRVLQSYANLSSHNSATSAPSTPAKASKRKSKSKSHKEDAGGDKEEDGGGTDVNKELARKTAELESLRNELAEQRRVEAELRSSHDKLAEDLKSKSAVDGEAADKARILEEELQSLRKEAADMAKFREDTARAEKLAAETELLRKELEQAASVSADAVKITAAKLAEEVARAEGLHAEVRALRKELVEVGKSKKGGEADHAELQRLRNELEDEREQRARDAADAEERIAELQEQKESLDAQYQNLLGRVSTIRTTLGERMKADAVSFSRSCIRGMVGFSHRLGRASPDQTDGRGTGGTKPIPERKHRRAPQRDRQTARRERRHLEGTFHPAEPLEPCPTELEQGKGGSDQRRALRQGRV